MKRFSTPRLSIGAAVAILAFSAATTGAFAQAGSLDPAFATAGIGTYLPLSTYSEGFNILTLADNSMLVCGYASLTTGYLTHILEDGTVDTSFGESNGYTFLQNYAYAMALALDQSIYLVGDASGGILRLIHVSEMGIPDADFGSEGVVSTVIGPMYDPQGLDILVQPDGKILVAGSADFRGTASNWDAFFARFLPDGSLDTSFNGTGIVTFENTTSPQYMQAVALMDDGSIVGAGHSLVGSNTNYNIFLIKLSADGTPDASFGTAGILLPTLGYPSAEANGVIVDDGSIYVVGDTWNDIVDYAYLAKFNADGTFDTSFGTNGSTLSDFNYFDYLVDLVAQPDGKIVACGGSAVVGYDNVAALTVRYGTDGLLDPTYGDAGKTITNVGNFTDRLKAVAIQPDGKIVVSGYKQDVQTSASMMVMRYLGDGTIGVVENGTSVAQFTIFPNPVSGTSTTLQLLDGNGAEVWISDLHGHMIGRAAHVVKGQTSVELDVEDLAAGMYMVNVLSQGTTTSLKMQVVK